ncbi:MAG: Hpt domain-containing protein [Pseudomonadota bacterium]
MPHHDHSADLAAAAASPLFDAAVLGPIVADDTVLYGVLLTSAEEDGTMRLTALDAAQQAGDVAAAGAALHALKGMAGSLGFLRAEAVAGLLLRGAEGGVLPDAAACTVLGAAWADGLAAMRAAEPLPPPGSFALSA